MSKFPFWLRIASMALVGHVLFLVLILLSSEANAKVVRSRAPLLEFRKHNVCPGTNRLEIHTPCVGYVIDHKWPLCAGGADSPENLQWQTIEQAKIKDKLELEVCRLRKKNCGA